MLTRNFVIHSVIFSVFTYTCYYESRYIHIGRTSYGGRFKFLTVINVIVQMIYFGLSSLCDLTSRASHPSRLHTLRDSLFCTLAFPLGIFVSFMFWTLYFINRDLVYPKFIDDIIPVYINHLLHTFVLPCLLVEMYLDYHSYPTKRKGLLVVIFFTSTYITWVLWVAYAAGIWIYPILGILNWWQLGLFFLFGVSTTAGFYIVGEFINNRLWHKSRKNMQTKIS